MNGLSCKLPPLVLVIVLVFPAVVTGQDEADKFHPFMSNRFQVGLGLFWPDKSLQIAVDGSDPSEEIDFEEDLGYDSSDSTGAFSFRWRYSKNWALSAQYWGSDSTESVVLENDIEWDDEVFLKGTYAKSGIDFSVTRVFLGRTVWKEPGAEFGLGGGLHWLTIDAFIEGQVASGSGTEFGREEAETEGPLPNVGGWYLYSWSPEWLMTARLDWLRASVDEYSGGLWHGQIGVHYQFSRIFGIGFGYSNFVIDLDVDDSHWHGSIESRQHGPRLELTASW